MPYFPVFLQLQEQPVVVFGGGSVAERKVSSLLAAQAKVTVVAPRVTNQLTAWAQEGLIKHLHRRYHAGDLSGYTLAFAATDDEAVNQQIAREAKEHNILVNVADRPELCSFILPSVVKRGDLTVAVSTAGKSPALAAKIRRDLEDYFGPEYEEYLSMIAEVRQRARAQIPDEGRRQMLFETILESDLLKWLRQGERARARLFLEDALKEAAAPQGIDS